MPSPSLSLQTTTLWKYPSQHYGTGEQGSSSYRGATPSWVIWNLLKRYTEPGQVVLDPMCGSGTTIDVAKDLGLSGIGFDLSPQREDIEEADARDLPLGEDLIDFVFIDPPYGKNLKYSGKEQCIGELDAREQAYFDAMKLVFEESWRVLRPGGHLAVYVCDVWNRNMFVPIGGHFLYMLSQIFDVVDHVAVTRGNKDLDKGNYHKAAEETNFFLRGFNHLIILRKPEDAETAAAPKRKKYQQPSPGSQSRSSAHKGPPRSGSKGGKPRGGGSRGGGSHGGKPWSGGSRGGKPRGGGASDRH